MNVKALILSVALPSAAVAQGFAGLGTAVEGFAAPTPNPQFTFPRDHGAHEDYRIEWWYLTANLSGPDGTPYGLQWTLFRAALAPEQAEGWASPQVWMGHAAVTTSDAHYVAERLGRGGIGQAGVIADPFEAWIDEWSLAGDWQEMTISAAGEDFAFDMTLTATGPLVLHGAGGYSVKSADGQASYYYSQPFFDISGTLHLPDGAVEVSGQAWLDREWSSQPLSDTQEGWDWFSLSFDSGDKMMGFRLNQTDGSYFTSGTWIGADGGVDAFGNGDLTATPLRSNGTGVPVKWRVEVPLHAVDVTVEALNDNAWMATSIPYWEGPVVISGSHRGVGYLEMTGYD